MRNKIIKLDLKNKKSISKKMNKKKIVKIIKDPILDTIIIILTLKTFYK